MALGKIQKPNIAGGLFPADDVVTLSRLESHLWEAANILRGPVDAGTNITGLSNPIRKSVGAILPDLRPIQVGRKSASHFGAFELPLGVAG